MGASTEATRKNLALALLIASRSPLTNPASAGAAIHASAVTDAASILEDGDSDTEDNISPETTPLATGGSAAEATVQPVSSYQPSAEVGRLNSLLNRICTLLSSSSSASSAAAQAPARVDARAAHGALVAIGLLGARLRKLSSIVAASNIEAEEDAESLIFKLAQVCLGFMAPLSEKSSASLSLVKAKHLLVSLQTVFFFAID